MLIVIPLHALMHTFFELLVGLLLLSTFSSGTVPVEGELGGERELVVIGEENVNTKYVIEEAKELAVASCFFYRVMDSSGNQVMVSEGLELALDCPPAMPSLHPTEPWIIYPKEGWDMLRRYDIETGVEEELYALPEELDGVSFHGWSPDGSLLLMFTQSFEDDSFAKLTQVTVLHVEEEGLIDSMTLDLPVSYNCGSASCVPDPEGLRWVDNRTIEYIPFEEVPYDLGTDYVRYTVLPEL